MGKMKNMKSRKIAGPMKMRKFCVLRESLMGINGFIDFEERGERDTPPPLS
jgi:hypothetical protein